MKCRPKHITAAKLLAAVWGCLLTSHAGVSAEATVELTVDQSGVKEPLAKQVEDAVDLGPGWGRQGPGLPAALVGAWQQGWRGRRLLLLLLGRFGWLSTTTLWGDVWLGCWQDTGIVWLMYPIPLKYRVLRQEKSQDCLTFRGYLWHGERQTFYSGILSVLPHYWIENQLKNKTK